MQPIEKLPFQLNFMATCRILIASPHLIIQPSNPTQQHVIFQSSIIGNEFMVDLSAIKCKAKQVKDRIGEGEGEGERFVVVWAGYQRSADSYLGQQSIIMRSR